MPTASVTVPHTLGQAEAAARLRMFIASIKQQYDGQVEDLRDELGADGGVFSFTVQGMKLAGTLAVRPTEVEVGCELPLLAAMFKGRIETELRDHLTRVLQ